MPFKYKKRYRRKRRFRRKPLATKAYVQKVLDKRVEDKSHEGDFNTSYYDEDGVTTVLTSIAQGDDESNRSGNEVMVKSIMFRAYAYAYTGANQADVVRTIIWIDRSPTSSLGASDILETTGSNRAVTSNYNTDKAGSYTILFDKVQTVNSTNSDKQFALMKWYKLFKKRHRIKFVGTGATNYGRGAIKITQVGIIPNASANKPSMFGRTRVMFEDA